MTDEIEAVDDIKVQDPSAILETLEHVEHRLNELKDERSKLFEANQMLVELVEHLEDELSAYVDAEDVGSLSVNGFEYSYKEGWRSNEEGHEARMELKPDVDVEGVESQIREVRKSISDLEQ